MTIWTWTELFAILGLVMVFFVVWELAAWLFNKVIPEDR